MRERGKFIAWRHLRHPSSRAGLTPVGALFSRIVWGPQQLRTSELPVRWEGGGGCKSKFSPTCGTITCILLSVVINISLFHSTTIESRPIQSTKKNFLAICGGPLKCGGPCSVEHVEHA